MKPVLLLFSAALFLAGFSNASEPPHDPASHEAHARPAGEDSHDSPAPAVRWQSDEALMRGMRRVRAATQALAHGAHGHLASARVTAIAEELDAAVQGMFAQCRLATEPDAALHPLLARVLQSSARLAKGEFAAGALADLEAVLARYPLLFEDASWSTPIDPSDAATSTPRAASQSRSNSVSS